MIILIQWDSTLIADAVTGVDFFFTPEYKSNRYNPPPPTTTTSTKQTNKQQNNNNNLKQEWLLAF